MSEGARSCAAFDDRLAGASRRRRCSRRRQRLASARPREANGLARRDLPSPRPRSSAAGRRTRPALHFRRWAGPEPRTQSDQYRANSTRPIFGVDVDGLAPGATPSSTTRSFGWPVRSLKDIPAGDYCVQALLNRYETFHRGDGHTIKMPMDQGEGQHWDRKPGNFYSKPVKMRDRSGVRAARSGSRWTRRFRRSAARRTRRR